MASRNDKTSWVDFSNEQLMKNTIQQSNSIREVLRNLGYYDKSSISRKKVKKAINDFNISIEHFHNRHKRWKDLPENINTCFSIADVLRSVGLTDQGGNHKTAKKYIKKFDLNIDHFLKPNERLPKNKRSNEDIFKKDSVVDRSTIRSRVLIENIIEYKCAKCGNEGQWLNKELRLQLDHINGISNDNRIENLRFLCPNCHTQTETWGQKNRNINGV